MEQLVKRRGIQKSSITRIITFMHKNKDNILTAPELIVRQKLLDDSFNKYTEIQDEIELEDETQSSDRTEVEEKYCNTKALIQTKLDNIPTKSPSNSSFSNSDISHANNKGSTELPKISLPVFSGKIEDWKSFTELFFALVGDNKNITNVEKLCHLKTCLNDEALKLINNLKIESDNFEVALDILNERYGNEFSQVSAHIKKLMDFPSITYCTHEKLRELIAHMKQNLHSLKNLNIDSETLLELFVIYIFSQKLDQRTRNGFEQEKIKDIQLKRSLPKLSDFYMFLEGKCLYLEGSSSSNEDKFGKRKVTHVATGSLENKYSSHPKCTYCSLTNHTIYKCKKFLALNHCQKRQFVHSNKLCMNCLGTKHTVANCQSRNCSICDKKHHTILHLEKENTHNNLNTNSNSSSHSQSHYLQKQLQDSNTSHISQTNVNTSQADFPIQSCSSQITDNVSLISTNNHRHILLATATIKLKASDGKEYYAKALLDNGSQSSFMTHSLFKKLKGQSYRKNIDISGISQTLTRLDMMTDIQIHSNSDNKTFNVSCGILPKITCKLPQIGIERLSLPIPNNIKLADLTFHTPSKIDLLLGSDIYYELLLPGFISLGEDMPCLQNTHLGWVLGGPVNIKHCFPINTQIALFTQSFETNDILEKFWHLEEIPSKPHFNPDDQLAEKIFTNTLTILPNGRFQVNLPLKSKNEHLKLGDSFTQASKRFYLLEKRFKVNPNLFLLYKEFIHEYISLNHGNYVPLSLTNSNNENKYFLPHHCVFKEDSSSTKLRVVFDASMKTTSGISLNDIFLKGYTVQPELFDIICRFRLFKFVLVADIKKMYRQMEINPSQRFLLNILWRDDPQQPLRCIELSTITYGTKCAPFLATRALLELAIRHEKEYPLALHAIKHQCYIDDILAGANQFEQLIQLHHQLINLLNSACISLHKWKSNSPEFLDYINVPSQSSTHNLYLENSVNKVLGLSWNTETDEFAIQVPFVQSSHIPSKRNILSIISQLFDPLGFIGPVILIAKLFMQKLWISKVKWDERVTKELEIEWLNFISNLSILKSVKIPRHIFLSDEIISIDIFGFSDASIKAYGACIYLRILYDNKFSSHLICSKSRVAPIRAQTLARLELCAALLLAKLTDKVASILNLELKINSVNLFTDSQIVLCWIKSHSSRWTTFVANRTSQIQELSTNYIWRHVKSSLNPADYISRGLNPEQIINCHLWWYGPEFLQYPISYFSTYVSDNQPDDIPEQRTVSSSLLIIHISDNEIFSRFSDFTRLHRVVAYCFRFCYNSKHPTEKQVGSLSIGELKKALNTILKYLQSQCFHQEISDLNKEKSISNKILLPLNPFLDNSGILRVGGRLSKGELSFDQKHPILLPAKHFITRLLIKREHLKLYHAGPQTVLSNLRLRYWPINGIRETKHVIKNCVTCHRFKAQTAEQIMADLPKSRISICRPFSRVGIDFGGPIFIKSSSLRKAKIQKAYFSVFVCMVTKAIHLELVSDLSSNTFILTLKRFIARRGNPTEIYSDNATNFIGAKNQLHDFYKFFKNQTNFQNICEFLSLSETKWTFIPPNSPHWGGLWEAAVKSTKFHIKRVIGLTHLTFESLTTVLAEIESILNSRPLCPLSNNPSDINFLTPGHFLIGTHLMGPPEPDVSFVYENRLTIWQRITQIKQHFWKRWSVEYLNLLQHRPKWHTTSKNLKVGDLVLIVENNTPPLHWPRGRILDIIQSKDEKVRVVKLQTPDGILTRPIVKVCPFPSSPI